MIAVDSRVFISYSRNDRHIVEPLVKLLRLRGDLVFFDVDSISPGQLWRDELETAIETASWFVLFWCGHSSQSREVEREFRAALALGKKIVPLLLDDTPLPNCVAAFHGIDFRLIPGLHPLPCTKYGGTRKEGEAQFTLREPPAQRARANPTANSAENGGPSDAASTLPQPAALCALFGIKGGTIGRSAAATLCLPAPERSTSLIHLEVIHADGCFKVRNRGMTPIVHAGKSVESGAVVQIADGDSLQLGMYVLTVSVYPGSTPFLRIDATAIIVGAPPTSNQSMAKPQIPDDFESMAKPQIPDDFDMWPLCGAPPLAAPQRPIAADPFGDPLKPPLLSPPPLFDLSPSSNQPPAAALQKAADQLVAILLDTAK